MIASDDGAKYQKFPIKKKKGRLNCNNIGA